MSPLLLQEREEAEEKRAEPVALDVSKHGSGLAVKTIFRLVNHEVQVRPAVHLPLVQREQTGTPPCHKAPAVKAHAGCGCGERGEREKEERERARSRESERARESARECERESEREQERERERLKQSLCEE